ncbi:hypothetical protein [Marinitenerispora sediminis]|uniref:Asp23/Gls24 family protein n=1 Tax=Marinitenerispora sediminis TaxID=1931232 RepID=A0A368T4J0_9ACTN|nr:hypothetical protein [Marinitenerispora sediminis]RCV57794.1 hypothetical protein DEF28_01115 [Marinitenerispora sediminis]RCV58363.1 hypothetical protein DEF24_13615 [Marinitenerispora sediminis]RCV59539.1 hypothetical protein DEF23_07085 [Marinitenerispora sediminis]
MAGEWSAATPFGPRTRSHGTEGTTIVGNTALARGIAERVLRCPEVLGLSPLPGRGDDPPTGVVVTRDSVEIRVRARRDRPLPLVAAQIQAAIGQLVSGHSVRLYIDGADTTRDVPF